jgi:hypothetical protein
MEAKRTRAALATAIVVVLGSAAIASAAPGDTTYTGSTDEGVSVKLTVANPGNATAFKIGKTQVECNRGGTLSNKKATYTDFDTSDPGSFADKREASSNGGGYHFETKSNLDGEIAADQASWSGSLKLATKVFRKGHKVDTCKLTTAWTAS